MNLTVISGRLTADPELSQSANGKNFVSFFLAVPRQTRGAETDFFKLVAWDKTAENICKYLHKGSRILISGKIRTRPYTDSEGVSRTSTEICINKWEFADSRPLER